MAGAGFHGPRLAWHGLWLLMMTLRRGLSLKRFSVRTAPVLSHQNGRGRIGANLSHQGGGIENVSFERRIQAARCLLLRVMASSLISRDYLKFIGIEPSLSGESAEFTDKLHLAIFFDLKVVGKWPPIHAFYQLTHRAPAGNP